jgi:hypothetical protein
MELGPFARADYVETNVAVQQHPTSWQATLPSCLNDMPHYQAELDHHLFLSTASKLLPIVGSGRLPGLLEATTPGAPVVSLLDQLPLLQLIGHIYVKRKKASPTCGSD